MVRFLVKIGLTICCLAFATSLFSTDAVSQNLQIDSSHERPPLFAANDMLETTLEADFDALLKDRKEDGDEYPARFTLHTADTTEVHQIQVRTRGNFRLEARNCEFPPLRLNFVRGETPGSLFEGQDKLKLVTHCQSRQTSYQQKVLQEFLAYRVYNLLTDLSYRVRLLRMTYVDTGGRHEPLTRFAFLIEDDEALAARHEAALFVRERFSLALTDPDESALFALFQYMIGNTDWYATNLHNVDLLVIPGHSRPYPVPYDFDHAGVVDAPYARPRDRLGIKDVRERLYLGVCHPEPVFDRAIERFMAVKDGVYDLYRSLPVLDERERRKTLAYFDEFYAALDRPVAFEKEIHRSCQPPK